MTAPMSGVCTPWTTLPKVKARPGCGELDDGIITDAISDASNMLYKLSQGKFSGECSTVVRPSARPRAYEERAWMLMTGYGYNSTWGMCTSGHAMGYSQQCWLPPEIDLGSYPVTAITTVKIDGITIPSNEYRIDNNKILTRVLPTATSAATARWGWPTCQRLDLPDTEQGTFSVAYDFGMSPPSEGVSAASAFAAQLAIHRSGGSAKLPERLTSITRQGVTMAVMDPMPFLDKGLTGIYEVDIFIRAHNPVTGSRRRPGVWSPDLGSIRRPT